MELNRRNFVKATASAAMATGASLSPLSAASTFFHTPNEQPGIGFIGTGIRFHTALGSGATNYGPAIAIADADLIQAGKAIQRLNEEHRAKGWPITTKAHQDYHHVLDNQEVDLVFIASPDHWHTKHVIDAMRAGKDVYCEKPLTLTIAEGTLIEQVQKETGRVLQIGTQQRTEFGQLFPKAAAIVRAGRIGDIKLVTACLGGARTCDSLPIVRPPVGLDWDKWLGPAPMTEYRAGDKVADEQGWGAGHPLSRTHRYYRWFYEYSGGKLTDWGAHHLDIAMLALDKLRDNIGKIEIDPLMVSHPVQFTEQGMPTDETRFNTATAFKVAVTFADGQVMHVRDNAKEDKGFDNGIMFEGAKGRILVNRGKLVGKPVEELASNPLPENALAELYGQPIPKSHIDNFIECVKTRSTPIGDLQSHNCMINLCHAINIALRLNRKLTYDPLNRKFVGDEIANGLVSREQRKGYEFG